MKWNWASDLLLGQAHGKKMKTGKIECGCLRSIRVLGLKKRHVDAETGGGRQSKRNA